MAKSSIFARVKIETEEETEAFISAFEKSEKETESEKITTSARFVSDPDKIRQAVAENRANKAKSFPKKTGSPKGMV